MPVPNSMADLATLASSNFPTGTEAIGNSLDNYLRALSAIIRSTNAISSSTIAAASTTNVGGSDAESVTVTGATTINSFGAGFPGCKREVFFTGGCTIVNSSSIILPNGVNVFTANGDVHTYRCTASGVWKLVGQSRMPVSDVSGLQAALDLKLNVTGNQTLFGEFLVRNGTLLGSVTNSIQNAGGVSWNTGNGDVLEWKAIRKSDGTGWPTASLRLTRVVDGVAAQGYIDFNGSASGKVLSLGYSIPGSDLAYLDGSGNWTATGNLISLSDERVKEHWRDLPSDWLGQLAGVKHGVYDRIDTGATQVGVGAASLRKVLPWAVHEDQDGQLSVAYGNAALVAAISLAGVVEGLEKRLAAVEARQ